MSGNVGVLSGPRIHKFSVLNLNRGSCPQQLGNSTDGKIQGKGRKRGLAGVPVESHQAAAHPQSLILSSQIQRALKTKRGFAFHQAEKSDQNRHVAIDGLCVPLLE